MFGDKIKIIIGSKIIAEGISIFNAGSMHILD